MKTRLLFLMLALAGCTVRLFAQEAPSSAAAPLVKALQDIVEFVSPPAGGASRAVEVEAIFEKASGSIRSLKDKPFRLKFQPPNRFFISGDVDGPVSLSSDGAKIWIHVPGKHLLLEGDAGVPRFSTRPDSIQATVVPEVKLPVTPAQIALLPMMADITLQTLDDGSHKVSITPKDATAQSLKIPKATVKILVADEHSWPRTISYHDGKNASATLRILSHTISESLPASAWQPVPAPGDKTERVALAHLVRFLEVSVHSLGSSIPELPVATGSIKLVATEGRGRLEDHDGTRVLLLAGTPEEMGRQQGVLLKKEIRRVIDRILYGVGVGSSFGKGRWFFGEIEEAVRRTGPFVDPRCLREMDAMADAAGIEREEVRLANFFPELFHCTGFALLGNATADGQIYHGRVLDYLRGVGLEENAVVTVNQPDIGHAWVNVGYAGCTGSVTAMNEKHLSIGEMGGRGEGSWDGKPMAQLIREVMEKASTIDEALAIMKQSPRTCEYYYVIADANSKRACGIKATASAFEVLWPGDSHPELNHPIKDTVLLSADERYQELVRRVKTGYGKFTADTSRDLMTRPVCLNSNIHSVLFAPGSLDFWVANADNSNVASATRYTKYNLRDLLK
jgi:Acyl-coenzyme A:6-aminopenicillanic acid acyl-transferase